jgi:RNA polymerase sigma-70 factor (ECF subfamily)
MPFCSALSLGSAGAGFDCVPWKPSRGGAIGLADPPGDARRKEQQGQARTNEQSIDDDRRLSFEQIHRKYQDKIYNLILRLTGDPDDANDLTVETFLNAYRAWDRFRGDAKVSTWLYQIAQNCCKNRFKQKDRQREREPISLDDTISTDGGELTREVADWRNAPERLLLDQELADQIRKAVEALPPDYREVLVLAQREELSYEEIAQITGLTVPAVKTRLHRARNKMRVRLEPYYRNWQRGDH